MLFQPQSVTPVIIKVVPPATKEVSVVNVLMDAFGLTALITIGAIIAGIVFGCLLILVKRWRDQDRSGGDVGGTRLDLSSH